MKLAEKKCHPARNQLSIRATPIILQSFLSSVLYTVHLYYLFFIFRRLKNWGSMILDWSSNHCFVYLKIFNQINYGLRYGRWNKHTSFSQAFITILAPFKIFELCFQTMLQVDHFQKVTLVHRFIKKVHRFILSCKISVQILWWNSKQKNDSSHVVTLVFRAKKSKYRLNPAFPGKNQ